MAAIEHDLLLTINLLLINFLYLQAIYNQIFTASMGCGT